MADSGRAAENVETDMNRRSPDHGRTTINLGSVLEGLGPHAAPPPWKCLWRRTVLGCRPDSDTTVGIDVAYIRRTSSSHLPDGPGLFDGVPVLAAEVLSPSDKHEDITEKVEEYLDVGVRGSLDSRSRLRIPSLSTDRMPNRNFSTAARKSQPSRNCQGFACFGVGTL